MNYKTFTPEDFVNPPTGLNNTNSQLKDLTSTVGLIIQSTMEMQVSKIMPSRGASFYHIFAYSHVMSLRLIPQLLNLLFSCNLPLYRSSWTTSFKREGPPRRDRKVPWMLLIRTWKALSSPLGRMKRIPHTWHSSAQCEQALNGKR